MNDNIITTVKYGKKYIEITWSDLWFIDYIRELGYGKLSNIEIQDGQIMMVKKCEKKIKPRKI